MEKKNRTQQTAESLYNHIVVEGRRSPGRSCPTKWSSPPAGREPRHAAGGHPYPVYPGGCWRCAGAKGPMCRSGWVRSTISGFSGVDYARGQLRDLFELRSIFEPRAARLACRRATEGELAEILRRGADVERCIRLGEDRTQADRAFHAAIVRAAHNEFMVRLLPMIDQAGVRRHRLRRTRGAAGGGHPAGSCAAAGVFAETGRGGGGARHAIHMHHSIDVMGLGEETQP